MVDWLTDYFWSIDPGESKCGVAIFQNARCVQAVRSVPEECLDKLWEHLGYRAPSARPAGIVLERFALRGDLAAAQTGSELGTVQMIGAIRWMCRQTQTPLVMQTPQNAHAVDKSTSTLVFRKWPQRRWASYGQGSDAKMAEKHGYFRLSSVQPNNAARNAWMDSLGD